MSNAATQTDIDRSGTATTLNITIPNSQVSVFHYETLAPSQDAIQGPKLRNLTQKQKSRPVSGVIVQPEGDSRSVVSFSLSNSFSVHSFVSSAHLLDKTMDVRDSLVFTDGLDVISLEVLPPTDPKESETLKSELTGLSRQSKYATPENITADFLRPVSYENLEIKNSFISELDSHPNSFSDKVTQSEEKSQSFSDFSKFSPQKNLEISVTQSSLKSSCDNIDAFLNEHTSSKIISQYPMLDRGFPGVSKPTQQKSLPSENAQSTSADFSNEPVIRENVKVSELDEQVIMPCAAEFQKSSSFQSNSDFNMSITGEDITPVLSFSLPPDAPLLQDLCAPDSSIRDSSHTFTETINNHDSFRYQDIVSTWPVLKSGYLLRKDVLVNGRKLNQHYSHTNWLSLSNIRRGSSPSSTRISNRKMSISSISATASDLVSSSSRLLNRSISNILTKKPTISVTRPITHSNLYHNSISIEPDSVDTISFTSTATNSPISPMLTKIHSPVNQHRLDDDWNFYYVEIRGCYMLFYRVDSISKLISASSFRTSVNPPVTQIGAESESIPFKSNLQRNNSGALKGVNNVHLKKVLTVFNKKPLKIPKENQTTSVLDINLNIKTRNIRESFSGIGSTSISVESASISSHKSSDSNQSGTSNSTLTAADKPKHKTLVSYISLKNSQVKEINQYELDQLIGRHSNSEMLTPKYFLLSTVGPENIMPISGTSTTSNSLSFIHQTVFDLILWEEMLPNKPFTPATTPMDSSPKSTYFPNMTSELSFYNLGNKNSLSTSRTSSSSIRDSKSPIMSTNHIESDVHKQELSEWLNAINSVISNEKIPESMTHEIPGLPQKRISVVDLRVNEINVLEKSKDLHFSPHQTTHNLTVSNDISSRVLSPTSDFVTKPIAKAKKLISLKFKTNINPKIQISDPMNCVKLDSSYISANKVEKLERNSTSKEPIKLTPNSFTLSPINPPSLGKNMQDALKNITRSKEENKKYGLDQALIVPPNHQKLFLGFFKKGNQEFTLLKQPTEIVASAGVPALINSTMTGLFRPAGGIRILRSETKTSKSSTLRRIVGMPTSHLQSGKSQTTKELSTSPLPAPEIPLTLQKCIALVEEIGLETEGLYRVPGSVATVDRLSRLFEMDASKVFLYPPMSYSPLISTISSPFIYDFTPNLSYKASRMSLADTDSSAQTSLHTTPPVLEKNKSLPLKPIKATPTKSQELNHNQSSFFSFYNSHNKNSFLQTISTKESKDTNSSLYDNDVHVVTGVIKSFLRNGLPPNKEPLCTHKSYDQFVEASNWRNRMIAIQDLVHFLPPRHFATLKFVCDHLYRVSQNSSKNLMTSQNLAIIFGPNFLTPPPPFDPTRVMKDMNSTYLLTEIMIDQCQWVFGPIEFEEASIPDDTSASDNDTDEELANEVEGFDENGQIGTYMPLDRFSPHLTVPKSVCQSSVIDDVVAEVHKPEKEREKERAKLAIPVDISYPLVVVTPNENEDNSESWSNVAVVGIDPIALSTQTEIVHTSAAEYHLNSRNQTFHHTNSNREQRQSLVETRPLSTSLVESYFSNRNDAH
ncbi:Rho GTPase-activating protein 21 [Nowakowskiella sp. JEL0078]|nr:Rho GTPase-activating protein 21 [Nowakowskiella sp. JEL0078]